MSGGWRRSWEDPLRSTAALAARTTIAALAALGCWLVAVPGASAEPSEDPGPAPQLPGPVQVAGPTADNADPAAVAACSQFADALDATAVYYGDFADALEKSAKN